MLGYAACFAARDVGLSDVVEKRRFAVVDVSHNGDDRRTRNEIFKFFFIVHFELRRERVFERNVGFVFEFDAEFVRNEFRRGKINAVVYRLHYAENEKRLDDFRCGFADLLAQSLDRHGVCRDDGVFYDNGCGVATAAILVDLVVAHNHFTVFVV